MLLTFYITKGAGTASLPGESEGRAAPQQGLGQRPNIKEECMEEEDRLPLEEYVKLPTTVDFQVINTPRFQAYAKDKPYLHFGTE